MAVTLSRDCARLCQDYQFYIQNFTALQLGTVVPPSKQATFEYSFIPAEPMGGRPFGLVINLNYKDNNVRTESVCCCQGTVNCIMMIFIYCLYCFTHHNFKCSTTSDFFPSNLFSLFPMCFPLISSSFFFLYAGKCFPGCSFQPDSDHHWERGRTGWRDVSHCDTHHVIVWFIYLLVCSFICWWYFSSFALFPHHSSFFPLFSGSSCTSSCQASGCWSLLAFTSCWSPERCRTDFYRN